MTENYYSTTDPRVVPTIRSTITPVTGVSVTTSAGTQIGDLLIAFYTAEPASSGEPVPVLQNGWTQAVYAGNRSAGGGAIFGDLVVAYKVATAAGSYAEQPIATRAGTMNSHFISLLVITKDTYDTRLPLAGMIAAFSGPDNNQVDIPAYVSPQSQALGLIGIWLAQAGTTNLSSSVPTGYSKLFDYNFVAANYRHQALATKTLAAGSENPAAWGDNITTADNMYFALVVCPSSATLSVPLPDLPVLGGPAVPKPDAEDWAPSWRRVADAEQYVFSQQARVSSANFSGAPVWRAGPIAGVGSPAPNPDSTSVNVYLDVPNCKVGDLIHADVAMIWAPTLPTIPGGLTTISSTMAGIRAIDDVAGTPTAAAYLDGTQWNLMARAFSGMGDSYQWNGRATMTNTLEKSGVWRVTKAGTTRIFFRIEINGVNDAQILVSNIDIQATRYPIFQVAADRTTVNATPAGATWTGVNGYRDIANGVVATGAWTAVNATAVVAAPKHFGFVQSIPYIPRKRVDIARYPAAFNCRRPFNPTTDVNTNFFFRNFPGGGLPWNGTASLGSSGSQTLTEATNPPTGAGILNGHLAGSFDGTNDRLTSNNAWSTYVSSSGTVSLYGWCLFQVTTAFTDPGAGAARMGIPCFFTEANEALAFGFTTSGVVLNVFDSGGTYTDVAVSCSTGTTHLARWSMIDSTSLNLSVDGGSFSSTSWTSKHMNNVNRTGLARVGCRGTGASAFLNGFIWDVCTVIGTPTTADWMNVKDYIDSTYGQRF